MQTTATTPQGISVFKGKISNFKFSFNLVEAFLRVVNSFASFGQSVKSSLYFFLLFVFFDWLSKKYPNEVLESLSPEVLSERLKKFYQELKKSQTEHYSASA